MTCKHPNKRLVWSTVGSSGVPLDNKQLREQCLDCGRLLAQAMKHSLATPDTPDVDIEALNKFIANRDAAWIAREAEWERQRQAWREDYQTHLQSNTWRQKRELVFRRARYTCEACGLDEAWEVHHLSYDNLGDEPLWELAAVCQGCHRRITERRRRTLRALLEIGETPLSGTWRAALLQN
jgi:hypothetical protein